MKKILRVLAALVLGATLPACGASLSCTRHADGRIECNVNAHGAGGHEKPVK